MDPIPYRDGLKEPYIWHIAKLVAQGMEFLRSAGFIHQDVKHENVLLEKDNGSPLPIVKLVDFGLALSSKSVWQYDVGTNGWFPP
jgi:serine/threonine protein kinase